MGGKVGDGGRWEWPDNCTALEGVQSGSGMRFPYLDFCKLAAILPVCYLNYENKVQEINFITPPRIQWGVGL